ncbi:MAG: alpha-mannosidase, partial [Armatimonadota bacterium]
ALPQILARFNISAFMTQKISWNQVNRFPHHTFWWQGIDGTRIWTHFPPADTYNGNAEPKEVRHSVANFKDAGRSDQSLYLFGFGDGGGGPTERHLEFLRRGREVGQYPEVALGKRASDFFTEARRESRDLMTWTGELYFELHRGTYTTQANNKRNNRVAEFLMRDAEYLAVAALPISPYPADELERLWKLVLLNQFHDIIPGTSVREVYVDSDRDYAEVHRGAEASIEASLRTLAAPLINDEMSEPVALFQNATAPTQGAISWPEGKPVPAALTAGGEAVPTQLVEAFGERTLVFPVPAAARGAVVIGEFTETAPSGMRRSRLKAGGRRLENDEWVVRFDVNGNIISIQSLGDGTEFVEPGKLANVFQLFDDQPLFWSAWDTDVYAYETKTDLLRAESFEVVERGVVRVGVEVVRRFGNSTVRQRITLGPTPGIRFDTEVDWREEDKMLKVAFPVNVNATRATYEIQFGNVERPTHYNTSWDWARFEVCAQKWADISEGEGGMALINEGKYGHDCHGNVLRLTLLKSPKAPDPMADMGVHRFTYTLVPHFGSYHHAGIVAAAYAQNAPLRTAWLEPTKGASGGPIAPFVTCDDRNVVIETVKQAEDLPGEGTDVIVRLYECHNTRGVAELQFGRMPKRAWSCDLEENELGEIELTRSDGGEGATDGTVPFTYKPFEILTFKVRF